MPKEISIGKQNFEYLIKNNCFYVDKTSFIKEWWESCDDVTLITRPRRFGKTLNMDMLNCFFSVKYKNRQDLFENLDIWKWEKYQTIQGTYPVIFLSFADVKADNIEDAKQQIKAAIALLYEENRKLLHDIELSDNERKYYDRITMYMSDIEATNALKALCVYFKRYYGVNTIIMLDEYDTPLQEAYIHGYWNEFTSFIRSLFNSTFKTNPYLERAIMTGITRVSKESIFSDLNNLNVVTATSVEYMTSFGFTEQEVFSAMDTFGLSDEKEKVKLWYDGFVFGDCRDIYNPWSITNFLDKKCIKPYWASTSSNGLINKLLQTASSDIKSKMERLMNSEEIVVNFDEQIVFEQLDYDENAIWSLLTASGYLRVESVEYKGNLMEAWYHLKVTNLETQGMFAGMFRGWFSVRNSEYNAFVKALLNNNLKEMNIYMNEVALATFSNFDTGMHPSEKTQPERFYHGFVLGLLVELRERYVVSSNRESGYGRYDVMLIPRNKTDNAYVFEFKVHEPSEESTLNDTMVSALKQIRDKKYDEELYEMGINNNIYHYGFAFEGKKVLIGTNKHCL